MHSNVVRHLILRLCTLGALALSASSLIAAPAGAAPGSRSLTADQRVLHVLNRLEFGPRPGEVAEVKRLGLEKWIEQQLSPESIDDSVAQAKLAKYEALKKTPEQLMTSYMDDMAKNRELQLARKAAQDAAAKGTDAGPPPAMLRQQMMQQAMRTQETVEGVGELNDAKLILAVESKRQLQEVLTDFWTNHFNVDAKKGLVRGMIVANERDAIRPHVLGKFRELLGATAKSPAMLFYLDNATSTKQFTGPGGQRRRGGGLNENYARELMELHTLGVDGGYTQKDVQEVARCFTGWSIDRQTGTFQFFPPRHDTGEKVVLGHTIAAGGGMKDGEQVLDILASSPAAAKFISRKLCRRLVSDEPPASLVEKASRAYLKSDGDIRTVVRAIVTAPEFYSSQAYQSKVKSPLEYAVSAVRALGATVDPSDPGDQPGRLRLVADGATSINRGNGGNRGFRFKPSLAQEVALMGEPLYSHEAPTGYPEDSREWVSAGSLLARFNFALYLSQNRIAQVQSNPAALVESGTGTAELVDALSLQILGTKLAAGTRNGILEHVGPNADAPAIAALILGSPDFQRR